MKNGGTANDNRQLDHGTADPDRHMVREEVAQLCKGLTALGVDRKTIASAMLDQMFGMLDGNPFRTDADQGLVRADLQYLWSIKHRVLPMANQWEKGWIRIEFERRPTFRFNRAAAKDKPKPLLRVRAPAPDYDPQQHSLDLLMLKMLPGHLYTEREVMTRYRRKMLRVLDNRHVDGVDRVRTLAASKKRVLGWMRRTAHLVTDQRTG